MSQARLARGRYGEDRAAQWYVEQGYRVLERNWRCRDGEVDLIVANEAVIVFCEVKARSSDRFGLPSEAVGHIKQRRLRRLAVLYLQGLGPHHGRPDVRFDVAAVLGSELVVLEAVF